MADDKVVTLTLSKEFASFLESVHRQHGITVDTINSPILGLDPGETTGVVEFDGDVTIRVYQVETKEIGPAYDWLYDKLESGCECRRVGDPTSSDNYPFISWGHVRYEDYRVYEWKAQDHSWSPVHTLRLIGAFIVALYRNFPQDQYSCCMASHAKKFWTDEKLKHFGLYPVGLRHGRDALRHLLYYMLFPTKVD